MNKFILAAAATLAILSPALADDSIGGFVGTPERPVSATASTVARPIEIRMNRQAKLANDANFDRLQIEHQVVPNSNGN